MCVCVCVCVCVGWNIKFLHPLSNESTALYLTLNYYSSAVEVIIIIITKTMMDTTFNHIIGMIGIIGNLLKGVEEINMAALTINTRAGTVKIIIIMESKRTKTITMLRPSSLISWTVRTIHIRHSIYHNVTRTNISGNMT
jgi:hypothetical protein